MKQLTTTIACLSLLAGVLAVTPNAQLGDPDQTPSESSLTRFADIAPDGIKPITDWEAATVTGTGWRSDFWCGAAVGAGFVLSATGVLTPVGVGLAAAGIYCALYL